MHMHLLLLHATAAELIFDASLVVGDTLLLVFTKPEGASRMFAAMDLHTGFIKENFYLVRQLQLTPAHQ
jgi:hypothetical protein